MKRIPAGLGDAGKQLWRTVTADYELSASELTLLFRACKTSDRLARIDGLIGQTSPLIVNKESGAVRSSPLYAMANETERVLELQLRALALPMPDEDEGRRRSPQQVAAARSRWNAEKQRRADQHG